MSISTNRIFPFRFPRKIFLKRRLIFRCSNMVLRGYYDVTMVTIICATICVTKSKIWITWERNQRMRRRFILPETIWSSRRFFYEIFCWIFMSLNILALGRSTIEFALFSWHSFDKVAVFEGGQNNLRVFHKSCVR